MKIILFQPQIPQNTGNIVRLCANTGSELFLVRPLGFCTSSRKLKRAGLDHWEGVKVTFLDDLFDFLKQTGENFYFFSSKALPCYTEIDYTPTDILIFGSETSGLDPAFHLHWPERFYTIPQKEKSRCLNLANAVSVVLYESLRQKSFTFI